MCVYFLSVSYHYECFFFFWLVCSFGSFSQIAFTFSTEFHRNFHQSPGTLFVHSHWTNARSNHATRNRFSSLKRRKLFVFFFGVWLCCLISKIWIYFAFALSKKKVFDKFFHCVEVQHLFSMEKDHSFIFSVYFTSLILSLWMYFSLKVFNVYE